MNFFSFTLTRGDTTPIGGTVTIITGGVEDPYPILPTDKVRFAAKWRYQDTDDEALFYLSSPDRVTIVDGPNGLIAFTIKPSDWATAFPKPISKGFALVADVQVSNAAGDTVYTLAQGTLLINPDVVIAAP